MTPFKPQVARIAVTPLTPIHIGCGETFEPTNYVIDENGLFAFDPSLATLNSVERSRLLRPARDANLQGIQKFFRDHPEPFIACSRQIIPVTNEIGKDYNDKIGKPAQQIRDGNNVINRLSIDKMICHPHTGIPFLPGSSLKGAIRTAILDRLNKGRKPLVSDKQATQWENDLLKIDGLNFAQSAFRLLKVSDLMAENPVHQIVKVTQYKKKLPADRKSNSSTIPARKQIIAPAQYHRFEGSISLQSLSGVRTEKKNIPEWEIKDLRTLAHDCNRYYRPHLEKDLAILERFQNAGLVFGQWLNNFNKLRTDLQAKLDSGDAFFVKLGQYGGAESKTYSGGVARIEIRHGKNKRPTYESTTTTIWLADCGDGNCLPFGWALVEIDPQGDLPALKTWCERQTGLKQKVTKWETDARERKRLAEEQIAQKKAKIGQEKAEQEAKRQAEEQAIREREEKMAAMSHGERTAEKIIEKLKGVRQGSAGDAAVSDAKKRLENDIAGLSGEERQKCIARVKSEFKKKDLLNKNNKEFFKKLEN